MLGSPGRVDSDVLRKPPVSHLSESRNSATVWRRVALVLALGWALSGAFVLRDWLAQSPVVEVPGREEAEAVADRLELEEGEFESLPGWQDDRLAEGLAAFRRSCEALLRLPPDRPLGTDGVAGIAGDWRTPCRVAQSLDADDEAAARSFFEHEFRPFKVRNGEHRLGLFTGYYEPLLHGSRRRHDRYQVPLYKLPDDLVAIELGRFRKDLTGRRIAGRWRGRKLEPYPDRESIEAGALGGRKLEIVWVDDPVDAFFLHIQGSGRVDLDEGGTMRLGYAGQNGQPYFAIGRELIARGAISRADISMQSIRQWLEENPDEAASMMDLNGSFVFFRDLGADGPVGAAGVVLTPGRSLAVDRRWLPLGAPVWLESRVPSPVAGEPDSTRRWLLVTQDTGGAIRGPVRGDVFWGAGDDAAAVAGRMKHRGRLWILLPRGVTPATADEPTPG